MQRIVSKYLIKICTNFSSCFSKSYTFFIKHNNVRWEIRRTYKELKELHKVLTKLVKSEFGIRCSEITSLDIKADWPVSY